MSERDDSGPSGICIEATRFYTVEELAPLLRVTRRTLRKYCNERIFPGAFKLAGARWLVPGSDVLALCPQIGHSYEADQPEPD